MTPLHAASTGASSNLFSTSSRARFQAGEDLAFLDEHPDSINDGFFINNPGASNWQDILQAIIVARADYPSPTAFRNQEVAQRRIDLSRAIFFIPRC